MSLYINEATLELFAGTSWHFVNAGDHYEVRVNTREEAVDFDRVHEILNCFKYKIKEVATVKLDYDNGLVVVVIIPREVIEERELVLEDSEVRKITRVDLDA